jgi:hypothetical protein
VLEFCHQTAEDRFDLRTADPVTVYITPLGRMYFEADWSSNQITLGFRSSPAVDVWLYSVYFGICHEYGHLVWHGGNQPLQEAWASFFGLHILAEAFRTPGMLSTFAERILATKDYYLTLGLVISMPFLPGQAWGTGCLIREWRRLVQREAWDSVRAFLHQTRDETLPLAEVIRAFAKATGCREQEVERWCKL